MELLDTRNMGHKVTPILTSASISGFKFTQVKCADRSIKNTDGNKPVVFATSLKNILSGTYKRNSQDLKNTAYVAGEGEQGKDGTNIIQSRDCLFTFI